MRINFTSIIDNTEELFEIFNKVYSENEGIFMFSSKLNDIHEILWKFYLDNKDKFPKEVDRVAVVPESKISRQYWWLNDNKIVLGVHEETIDDDGEPF